jgi:AAA15 family ATPase/GTPase
MLMTVESIMPQYPLDIGIEAVPSKCKTGANIINLTAVRNAKNSVSMPFPYLLNRNKFKKDGVARSWSQHREERLRAEIGALKQELMVLKQEKVELESLLKTQEEAKKLQIEEMQLEMEMQLEIDLHKLVHQVAEITQTKYFQQLQAEVEYLQNTDC